MSNLTLKIGGMSCEHCAKAVKDALLALPGVRGALVDLKGMSAGVEYDPALCAPETMKAAVADAGYEAE
ncbi:MAG: heavy-metal-associated domain-containing protein [Firmicutes bacterium]|nr:heavy-metal-associated domain-containing protein [Bacillota bacterium]